jgi:hypothetical protein
MEYSWFFLFVMIALCVLMMRGGIRRGCGQIGATRAKARQ